MWLRDFAELAWLCARVLTFEPLAFLALPLSFFTRWRLMLCPVPTAYARWKEAYTHLISMHSTVLDAATMALTWQEPENARRSIALLRAYVQAVHGGISDHDVPLDLRALAANDAARVQRAGNKQRHFVLAGMLRDVLAAKKERNPIAAGLDAKVSALLSLAAKLFNLQNLGSVTPLSYSIHLRSLLMMFLWTLPPVLFGIVRRDKLCAPVVVLVVTAVEAAVAWAFAGIDAASREAEAPMGDDENDVDVHGIVQGMCDDLQLVLDNAK